MIRAMQRITVSDLLEEARRPLARLSPAAAAEAAGRGDAILVDIRSDVQRADAGLIPGAIQIDRNVLEWRADPASGHSDPRIADLGALIVIVCSEGYQSSLAAATLQRLGFSHATDMEGGFEAWAAAGLPVEPA
jgi:rhodanese-related sulfurtransferase